MDEKQIVKQLEWLDESRRKDQSRLSSLEEKIDSLENNIDQVNTHLKDITSDLNRFSTLISRMDSFDEELLKSRVQLQKDLDNFEKQINRRFDDFAKIEKTEIGALSSSIDELSSKVSEINDIKRSLSARVEEEKKLNKRLDELRAKNDEIYRSQEEYTRNMRLINDGRRRDTKRINDLNGEVTAIRKQLDEQHGKIDIASINIKKDDNSLQELISRDAEKHAEMDQFIKKQQLIDTEREHKWKEWQSRFELIESQTDELMNYLQILDSTNRSIQSTQKSVEELSEQVERRINEITEMQRLAEDRFRQEWVTFRSDDQKRWTNYTLTMEEQRGELQRQQDKMRDRMTNLEDETQEIEDLIEQMNEQTNKRLQSLLSAVHEWVTNFERSIGSSI